MGNIHSVQKALESLGAQTLVTNSPQEIDKCDKLVLPGVGAFDDAVLELERRGLIDALSKYVKNKKAFLGICLGMQLLFEKSEEARTAKGLGILKGRVVRFKRRKDLKVPHIGWNQLEIKRGDCALFKGIAGNPYVYFCHSYYPEPGDKSQVAATTGYGNEFTSVVWQDNVYGVQFHPEKSQDTGMKILKNFVQLC